MPKKERNGLQHHVIASTDQKKFSALFPNRAQRLLSATKDKAEKEGLPCAGLLVDKGNPAGEALYASVGFRYVNDNWWGGHPMQHLVL